MSHAQNSDRSSSRGSATVAAFLLGVPMSLVVLGLIEFGPLSAFGLKRYIEHPVEIVEVVLFCCALGALTAKSWGYVLQRAACRREMLPQWDGTPILASEAPSLRAELHYNAGRMRGSWLARRFDAILDFVAHRRDANGLDDQLRALADSDAIALDNSYSLIRFITWAIPILGFLGTVLGITQAIAGVTPEILERSLSSVTEGLSLAFDTTAVGLALTMVTMFLSFLTERLEQSVLERVDHIADIQLAHRFERGSTGNGDFAGALRQNAQILLQTTEQLVHKQAQVWAGALAAAEGRWAEADKRRQEQLTTALAKALEKTLNAHQARLTAVEDQVKKQSGGLFGELNTLTNAIRQMGKEHHESLPKILESVAAQTNALAKLQDDGKQLIRLQDVLHHNLAALHGAGTFDQAVQSLTAAIHLLTAKVAPGATGPTVNRLGSRPGAAA
jgi:biopolymer transport protein ExbB/TolQ